MTTSNLDRLFAYSAWANARACDGISQLAEDVPERAQALRLLGHILNAGKMWRVNRLEQRDVPPLSTWPGYSVEECREKNGAEHEACKNYLGTLQDSDLTNLIAYKNIAGDPFTSSIEDILMHLVNHATHHRGQVMQLVRQGGGSPESTDYIGYTRIAHQHV